MKDQTLPADLQKYIKTYIAKKLSLFFGLEAVIVLILCLWGKTLLGSSTGIVLYALYAAVLIIPFFVTKIPFCLLDKSYFGTIEKVEMETSLESTVKGKPSLEGMYTAVTVKLHIKEEGTGKYHTVKIGSKGSVSEKRGAWDTYSVGGDDGFVQNAEQAFTVGARVFHLFGSGHIVVLDDQKSQKVRCAICGQINDSTNEACQSCGHTLVK